jgi:hypothetical protein
MTSQKEKESISNNRTNMQNVYAYTKIGAKEKVLHLLLHASAEKKEGQGP